MKSKVNIKKNNSNSKFPHLPEKEMRKLVEELSNPNLIPQPYLFNSDSQDFSDKFKKVINELVVDYNRKMIEVVEEEKKMAFEAGKKEGIRIHGKN
jgi:hypothetical protein